MRVLVGVTDNEWASFLRDRPHLSEANFWLPSQASRFRALKTGEPFLFKTHWPDNRLVGGGFFSGFAELSIAEAWDIHGEGNGVDSLESLIRRIAHYRKGPPDPRTKIGCVLLRDLFFTSEDDTLEAPADFAKNIVRFKGYDLLSESPIERRLMGLLERSDVRFPSAMGIETGDLGPTRGLPRLTLPRVGQSAFKSLILTTYHRRCAITGNRVEPVLQAAHIRPVAKEGQHRVDNGLLLRSDVHILFDAGYLGIDRDYRLRVSPRLRETYGNGDEFYSRSGRVIDLPDARLERPSSQAIDWHMDTCFMG